MPRGRVNQVSKARDFKKSFRDLLKYLKAYKWAVLLAVCLIVVGTVLFMLATRLVGDITNELQTASDDERAINFALVTKNALIALSFLITNYVFNYSSFVIMTIVSQNITYRLRKEISEKINRLPLSFYDHESFGDILSRITNDVDITANNLSSVVNQTFQSITMIISAVVLMFTINVPMTFVTFCCIPLSLLIVLLVVRFSQKYFRIQQNALGTVNGKIEEIFTNHTIVKAYNLEPRTMSDFDTSNNELYNAAWKSQFYSGIMNPLFGLVGNLAYITCALMGAFYAIDKVLLIGDVQVFITSVRNFNQPLSNISSISASVQNLMAANERIMDFLGASEEDPEDDKTATIENVKGSVEFDHVVFGYDPNVPIIHDFSAKVTPGQKVAIVGPTGAGKTTLISLLMRFYDIQSGDIRVDGVSIYDMKRSTVRDLFGMVLQDTWLFRGTIRENLTYGKEISDKELEHICKEAKIDHMIKSLPGGYNMELTEDSSISQGQKQLLTIARAMVQNSPMLILDEATSNVDTRTEELIQEAMDRLTVGRTSFVIAHRLSTIKNADLILVLRDGNIVEQGTHAGLLSAGGFYSDLYRSQFENK